jgi:hypothetical protein
MHRTEISPTGEQTIIELTQDEIDLILANQSSPQPDPIAFFDEMIGATGGTALTTVYQSVLTQALSPVDSSSLVAALLVFNGALNRYTSGGFAASYDILKGFLTTEQIVIVDEAIARYHL